MENILITLLLSALLPFSALCIHLPAPVNVKVDSQHFIHLLCWEAGPGSPEGVHYTVVFRSYWKNWMTVEGCEMVHSPLRCNLTEVLSEPYETYYISVSAHLGNLTSTPINKTFIPLESTVPEPPSLTLSPCNESVCVHLQAPSERLHRAYNCIDHTIYCFIYKLDVTSNGELKLSKEMNTLKTVVLEHLVPGKQYCVSVSIVNRTSAKSPAVCTSVSTTSKSVVDTVISVVLCLATLLFCVSFGVLLVSGFLCLKTNPPSVLSSFQGPYNVLLLALPTKESLTTVLLEPSISKDAKGDRDSDREDECKEDEEVAYESLKGQTASLETSSPSICTSPEVQYESPHDGGPVSEIPASPIQVPKVSCSTAPIGHALTSACRTGFGFRLEMKEPQAAGWTLSKGPLLEELRNKDLGLLERRHNDKEEWDAEVECVINVNLLSLTLGCRTEEEELEQDKAGKVEIQELLVPSSFYRVPENGTDIKRTYSSSPDRHVTEPEEDEKEEVEEDEKEEVEEEEEENYLSDYMKRN